ncbi:MAG: hypothetical protein GWN30_08585, partial [Gammaproteobacteria bacterium]|nr:hypothetical protein [Gammaproteobacteria bacterium]
GLEYVRMDGEATGFSGGLYPGGSNEPPQKHLNTGLDLAQHIIPLDRDGNPDPQNGQIGLLSLGMSNTAIEFGAFTQLAMEDPQVNSQILFINGALSGATSDRWLNPDSEAWSRLANTVGPSGLQVQVAWVKLTQVQGGDFPQKAQSLQADLVTIVQHLK